MIPRPDEVHVYPTNASCNVSAVYSQSGHTLIVNLLHARVSWEASHHTFVVNLPLPASHIADFDSAPNGRYAPGAVEGLGTDGLFQRRRQILRSVGLGQMAEFDRAVGRQFGVSRRQHDRKTWMARFDPLR